MSIQTYLPRDFSLLTKPHISLVILIFLLIMILLLPKKKQKPEEFKISR
ncbi:MAG: hypothetical protein N3E38_02165 [Candidatus Aenigmarchaeota archaeon]|nr:hypothetical protein [Candidatus Aenigmarchaeota archaeon]